MKKMMLCSVAVLTLVLGTIAHAEMISGKITHQDGNTVVVQQNDGTQKTVKTNDHTMYRQKKIAKHSKMKNGKQMQAGEGYYKPMVEEDDWVEIVYTPSNNNEWIAEDVVIYDD